MLNRPRSTAVQPMTRLALVGDHLDQEFDDFRQQVHPVIEYLFAHYKAALVVPITALSSRSQRVLVKPRPVLSRAPRVTFTDVRADRADSAIELIGQPHRPPILHQLRHIPPSQV